MPDDLRALDRRVAEELLGWECSGDDDDPEYRNPSRISGAGWAWSPLPAFSSDPSVAVQVLAGLAARGMFWKITWDGLAEAGWASVGNTQTHGRPFSTVNEWPRALCEATLAALGLGDGR